MPFNNFGQFVPSRNPAVGSNDPYRLSAEQFVKQVEEYLYDTQSARFKDPHFLAWAIAAFDHNKQGSGRSHDSADYEAGVGNLPGVQNPPLLVNGHYYVERSRSDWNAGKVPSNYDGTQADVLEHAVYHKVLPPQGEVFYEPYNEVVDDLEPESEDDA